MDAKEARAYLNGAKAYSAAPRRSRRPLIICAVAAFIFFSIFFSTSSVSDVSTIARDAAHNLPSPHMPHLQDFHNPFKSSTAHKPAISSNSSSGTTKWYGDLKWLNPFSSSTTFDEDRVVLPPLKEKPIIYTYYEPAPTQTKEAIEEERKILTLWRRAWWAKGFWPVVISSKEAMQNPLYEKLHTLQIDEHVKTELMRWLAWSYMGPGVLANWLLLPMAQWNHADFTFLRKGDYGQNLVRYETMGNTIYACSNTKEINKIIETVINSPSLEKSNTLQDLIPDSHAFSVQVQPSGFALYDLSTVASKYPKVKKELGDDQQKGLKNLRLLMNFHLHGNFLEQFPAGIAVLNTENTRNTILASLSVQLAEILNKCSESPIPESCPPNRMNCRPCKVSKTTYMTEISNHTDSFTIGIVPHPYTSALLQESRSDIDVPWVRRSSKRDIWTLAVTDNLKKGLSAYNRIITFKDLIANDETRHSSIWYTAERDWTLKDLEWHFGFSLPRPTTPTNDQAKSHQAAPEDTLTLLTPTLNSDPEQLTEYLGSLGTKRPTRAALVEQARLVKTSQQVLTQEKFKGPVDMRQVVEAWNLADTEAWRFVGALALRERLTREKWDEEERGFLAVEKVR